MTDAPLAAFEMATPPRLPTPNQRWHWGTRAALNRDIRGHAAMVALSARVEAGLKPCGKERRRAILTLVRAPGEPMLDRDNLAAGLKPVLDALGPPRLNPPAPGASLIHDDRDEFLDVTYQQEHGPKGVIRVEIWAWD